MFKKVNKIKADIEKESEKLKKLQKKKSKAKNKSKKKYKKYKKLVAGKKAEIKNLEKKLKELLEN